MTDLTTWLATLSPCSMDCDLPGAVAEIRRLQERLDTEEGDRLRMRDERDAARVDVERLEQSLEFKDTLIKAYEAGGQLLRIKLDILVNERNLALLEVERLRVVSR